MNYGEVAQFELLMKQFYRNKAERLERQFEAVFHIAADLLRAIEGLYGDGSNINAVSELAQVKLGELRKLIAAEPPGGEHD